MKRTNATQNHKARRQIRVFIENAFVTLPFFHRPMLLASSQDLIISEKEKAARALCQAAFSC